MPLASKIENEAGKAMGGLLFAAMMEASTKGRDWYYGWERDAVRWLRRHIERGGRVNSAWTLAFIAKNPQGTRPINFNLKD